METNEQTTNAQQQYPLAFDGNGDPIALPREAVAWRVRRGGGRPGRPRVVFDADTGRQLEIPLTGTIEDLVEVGCVPGRYRLEAVDGNGRVIPNIVAITEIVAEEPDEQQPAAPVTQADAFARVVALAEKQSVALCDALGHLSSSFGPIRPAQVPVVVTQGGGGQSLQPQQIIETVQQIALSAKSLIDAWKQGGSGTGTGGTGAGGISS